MKIQRMTMTAMAAALLLALSGSLKAQVVINEVVTDATDYCEIANFGASAVNIGGWELIMTDDPSATTTYTFPAGTMIAPYEVIVVAESATSPVVPAGVQRFETGANINWVAAGGGACGLNDGSGAGVDLVLFGNPTLIPTQSPASPFTGSVNNTLDVLARNSNTDSDTAADWAVTASGTDTPGALNPGQSALPTAPTASFSAAPTSIAPGGMVQFMDTSSGTPTSWAWDFENDGMVDSTAQNPTHVYNTLGSYDVRLTVTNALGSDTLTQTGFITVANLPTVPYTQNFNGGVGSLGAGWSIQSTTIGLIEIGAPPSASPVSGGDALLLHASGSGTIYTNQATLQIDLAGANDALLRYWAREAADEADADDGLFISDGIQTVLAASHQALTATWEEIEVDIGDVLAQNGMQTGGVISIMFRQTDNFPIPTDGLIIDDVQVLPPPVPDIGQANQATAYLDINAGENLNGEIAVVGTNGPFFASGNVADIEIHGSVSWPYALIFGPLNRNNAIIPNVGSLDIGLLGMGNYSDILVVMDGANPVTFFDFAAFTDATGESHLQFDLTGFPVGVLGTFQVLAYQPASPFFKLSAAFEYSIP